MVAPTGGMPLMPPFARELWTLAFWWSVWTLADTYLTPYTPTPELIVLAACLTTLAVVAYKDVVPGLRRKLETELACVTQSHTGGQYDKQVDPVVNQSSVTTEI